MVRQRFFLLLINTILSIGTVVIVGCATKTSEDTFTQKAQSNPWYSPELLQNVFGDFKKIEKLSLVGDQKLLELQERGRYLVQSVAACGSCHGERAGDTSAALSGGRTMYDRFGFVVAPNITPDLNTGIGSWNIAEVVRAIRASIDKDGKPLSLDLHNGYRWLSDQDAYSVAIYLFSLQPVSAAHERRVLGQFERRRWGLFSQHQEFAGYVPAPVEGDDWHYGRYLSHQVARCKTCHTAGGGAGSEDRLFAGTVGQKRPLLSRLRSLWERLTLQREANPEELMPYLSDEGKEKLTTSKQEPEETVNENESTPSFHEQALREGVFPVLGPDIRGNSSTGLITWAEKDIVTYLSTGSSPEGVKSDGRFCPWPFFQGLKERDKQAIAAYLKRL